MPATTYGSSPQQSNGIMAQRKHMNHACPGTCCGRMSDAGSSKQQFKVRRGLRLCRMHLDETSPRLGIPLPYQCHDPAGIYTTPRGVYLNQQPSQAGTLASPIVAQLRIYDRNHLLHLDLRQIVSLSDIRVNLVLHRSRRHSQPAA